MNAYSMVGMMEQLQEHARELDQQDELSDLRAAFWIPPHAVDGEQVYLCGHSLGLQPRAAEQAVQNELQAWRKRAVGGHFEGQPAWLEYADDLADSLASLVGAAAGEVAVMNTLTVNLHLLMVSFYRPTAARKKILIEQGAFPSDRYAVSSQIRFHGLDPAECMVELPPRAGDRLIDEGDVENWLAAHGEEVALVLWPGIQYASGQAFDLHRIAAAAHAAGARIGFDLAHSAGNLPLRLHDSGCDFAAWCNYKYLNGGPGAIGACFVHSRHAGSTSLPRFEGWWGNDRNNRFQMEHQFTPAPGAEAWQLSTPPVLAIAPLRSSLALFKQAGMERLRAKSRRMTGWLAEAIDGELGEVLEILTPADPDRRGCQLSLRVRTGTRFGRDLHECLTRQGIVTDWREPDILRVAPVPLYNCYHDCWSFIRAVADWTAECSKRRGEIVGGH